MGSLWVFPSKLGESHPQLMVLITPSLPLSLGYSITCQVAALELAMCFLPFNLTDYVPNFFFGATLLFIGFDLMHEWLVEVYHRLLWREYVLRGCRAGIGEGKRWG